ncbi:MAG: hypothetical protein M0Q26_01050 [Chitinophagaceae bacterium]|nr:hypothetical protein [Chitinophagaceae bacterium]
MKNPKLNKAKKILSKEDLERLELLEKARQKKGKQLRVDLEKGDLAEVDELRQLLGKKSENPEEKYQIYYTGITNLLKKYLPKGKEFKEGRGLIYDEKNVFLNRGKKKSDNPNGIRKSDGRMTYQAKMNEMLDVVSKWVSTSQNSTDIYLQLYELNEKHGYGHENYDKTSKNSTHQKKL